MMITGYAITTRDNMSVVYDYSGVLYPTGDVGGPKKACFNHDQIASVLHKGYETEEQKKLSDRLLKLMMERA